MENDAVVIFVDVAGDGSSSFSIVINVSSVILNQILNEMDVIENYGIHEWSSTVMIEWSFIVG